MIEDETKNNEDNKQGTERTAEDVQLDSQKSIEQSEQVQQSQEPKQADEATEALLEKKWFAVRVRSGKEKKVKDIIDQIIVESGLGDKMSPVYIPYEKLVEIKDGKKKSKVKNIFPGYVLIEMVLDRQTKSVVLETQSVVNFLGTFIEKEPVPLRQEEVSRIFETQRTDKVTSVKSPFEVGASARVTNGPFGSLAGVIQEVHNDKMKLKMLINFFGRSTPVEVDFSDVKLITD